MVIQKRISLLKFENLVLPTWQHDEPSRATILPKDVAYLRSHGMAYREEFLQRLKRMNIFLAFFCVAAGLHWSIGKDSAVKDFLVHRV